MPIFDYKGEDARPLLSDAWGLAAYTGIQSFASEGALPIANPLLNITYGTTAAPPDGWREIPASALGIGPEHVDFLGFIMGDGPTLQGLQTSQAKIWGEYDGAGNLTKISLVLAPTNNVTDVIDYPAMITGEYIHAFDYLIDALTAYTKAHGLTGKDVLVTGYSLGAGATDDMFALKDTDWGGFYAESDYLAAEVPKIVDRPGIFNIGFENDVVYRAAGDAESVGDALDTILFPNDPKFNTTVDNLILFDDAYASPLWPYGIFSIPNLTGWISHIEGVFLNIVDKISASTFYDSIEQDSVILVSHLTALTRPLTWVYDRATPTSDHFGDPAFLIGTQFTDRLQDGRSDDFLDGFAGNDRFRLSSGTDTVAGGEGTDAADLAGSAGQYDALKTADGTLFLLDRTGANGLKGLHDVERVTFQGTLLTTYKVEAGGLNGGIGKQVAYVAHQDGGAGVDALTGSAGDDRVFGLGGNDRLSGGRGLDLLHGGDGDDALVGSVGNDTIYGGAGNDTLRGDTGNDVLSGGVGSDRFVFRGPGFGNDVVGDFNIHEHGHDLLVFSADLFASTAAVLAAAHQQDDNVVIGVGTDSVTLIHTQLADLGAGDLLLA
ncbi:calcium-binding protein [Oleomonas cavernae]|uniref:Calcium-binding protein n=1 Tax=Oleomonas cavernae TaxID=2320859 RepID=A0A418WGD2_9PROT|nr:calcium-binding protein [Oleomonas cavernae]RJF89032.1 calcium-binding protein [Oleomonas cavernae]